MPGMNSGLDINDPIVVAAFRSALLHQGIAALLIFAVLAVAWVAVREWRDARAAARPAPDSAGTAGPADAHAAAGPAPDFAGAAAATIAEPGWRQLLRLSFGILWVFDGILQAQPAMALGLPSQVIQPAAATSPHWVQHLVNWAGTAWSYHPVQAGAAAVWIQVGIGLWLMFAPRGTLSRLAGLASVGWGLIVWVFGEAFGGVLAPGLSWLTGAPGGVLFYVVAGALIALPVRHWRSPWLGRLLVGGSGIFLVGMAVLQAWPGRGFWQGTLRGAPGSLTSMIQGMATTSQPAAVAGMVSDFGGFVRAHGFAVNLFAVLALAAIGVALISVVLPGGVPSGAVLSGARRPGDGADGADGAGAGRLGGWRRGLALWATGALSALCLATWVLVQDFGFFGGLGTDPNSMIPMALLVVAAYLALTGSPRAAQVPAAMPDAAPTARQRFGRGAAGGLAGLRPGAVFRSFADARLGTVLAASAIGVVILGAAPMVAAQASPNAAPILARAIDGSSAPLHSPAPGFALTDQHGAHVSLASLRGKAVLLTFLDPVCVTDCPLEAQEFREAGVLLGADASKVELVAVNLNPLYSGIAYTRAFDREQQLSGVRNWMFLTGSPAQLRPIWRQYGVVSQTLPAGSMLGHSDAAYVIDPDGRMREELDFDPGPGTSATVSSFATELASAARQALAAR